MLIIHDDGATMHVLTEQVKVKPEEIYGGGLSVVELDRDQVSSLIDIVMRYATDAARGKVGGWLVDES